MNDSQKSTIKRIVQVLVFLLLLSLGAVGIYNVFKWKDTSGAYFSSMDQMYDLPAEVVDVAFFGPSTVYYGINPAVFWEKSGIPSFNAAISCQDREASYYYVKEFCKRQSPKVVVMSGHFFEIDHYEVQGNIYRNTLSMHNSKNFYDVVNTIVPGNDKTGTNTVWDYYLRWPVIHNRYKEIQQEDFEPVIEYENALGYLYAYVGNGFDPDPIYFDSETATEITPENKAWVDKLVELAKEEGFELLFVQIPGLVSETERADLNGNYRYLEELGIKYIDLNFCAEEMDFNYIDDMIDLAHPKTSGARKISEYICDYIGANYALEDKRGQSGYELFDAAVRLNEHEDRSAELADCDDLARLLELVGNGDGYVYTLSLRAGSGGVAEENVSILSEYASNLNIWTSGGTAIINDGAVTEVFGDNEFSQKLNASRYLYVNPLRNGEEHWDEVYYGNYLCKSGTGNFIAIYDKVLDKLVVTKEIY